GEGFFAKGRSDANYALKQKALKEAKRWRLHLRARVLERLEDLNRKLIELLRPGNAAQLKLAAQGEVLSIAKRSPAKKPQGGAGGGGGRARDGIATSKLGETNGSFSFEDADEESSGDDRARAPSEGAPGPSGAPSAEPAPMPPMSPAQDQLMEKEEQAAPGRFSSSRKMKSKRAYRGRGGRSNRQAASERLRRSYGNRGGLSAHRSAELARLGFLPVEDAPAPPAPWQGFANLFPHLPLRAFDPQTTPPNWPDEVKTLVAGLDRTAWLRGQALSLEITTSRSRTDHRGRVHPGGEGLGLLSPDSWANRPSHVAGDNTIVQWAIGKERGALQLLWKTGRTRPAKVADLTDYPQLTPNQNFFRHYGTQKASIKARTATKITLVFRPPVAQRRWAYQFEVDIDPQRGVILEHRSRRRGKVFQRTVFSDFVHVAGKSWPTKETHYDAKGRPGWITVRRYRALAAPEAATVRAAILAPRKTGATVIGPLPGLEEARQAVESGKSRLEDRLVAVSLEIGQQRWEAATPQVETLIKGLGDVEAVLLFQATWRSQRRRLEELRTLLYTAAAVLAEAPATFEVARANAILGWSYTFGPAEQLVVLDRLRGVFARQLKRVDPALSVDERRVSVLSRAGRGEESFRLRATLTKSYPFVPRVHVAYAQALASRGEDTQALAHLDTFLETGGPWLPSEASQFREAIARQLWQTVRYGELVKRIDAWDAAKIDPALATQHYERLLAALIMLDREDEVDERIAAWFAAFPKDALGGDAPAWNRLQGSINHLLGQIPGINNYGNSIPPERQALLTKIASRLLSAAKAEGLEPFQTPWAMGARILYDWRYRRGDSSKLLSKELYAEFSSGIATLETTRLRMLCEWLRGIGFAPAANREAGEGKPAAGWPKLFAEIYARWAKTPPSDAADDLQVLVLSYAKRDLQLACRRRLLELAKTPTDKRARRAELYGALVSGPWTQGAEGEVLTLFQAMAPATELKGEILAEAKNAWIANLHDLHGWLTNARGAASFQALPNRNQLDRRQVKAQRDALVRAAR
ncbi:MAG: hypothetical protein JKY65_12060, partial [Planctomycetes bacterium]|nr:hypothetical protein [Planctomycetota bacterium]